jgi:hypothetical protein
MTVIIDEAEQPYSISKAVHAFGTLPGSFSLAVYLLLQNPTSSPIPKTGNCAFQIKRLLSVKAVERATRAAAHAYSVEWKDTEELPDFDSLSIGSILVSIYLNRRIIRMTDSAEWAFMSPFYYRDILASGLAIQSVYRSGLGIAVLGTSAIYSAIAALCAIDKKAFKEYRRRRKQERFFINSKLEQELFGCSALSIAKEVVQGFRFGSKIVEAFVYGFDLSVKDPVLPAAARPFRTVAKVLTTIYERKKPDSPFDASVLGLDPTTTSALSNILSAEHQTSWLNGDITHELND